MMAGDTLTAADIRQVQSSFAKVAPISDTAAKIFYDRLFEVAPQVRPMFKGPIEAQGRKLMTTLGVVVNGLRDMDKILPVARDLAIQHVEYGVTPEHYETVGACLIYTLHQGLGEDMTPELEQAWVAAYTALSGAMISAAYGSDDEGAQQ